MRFALVLAALASCYSPEVADCQYLCGESNGSLVCPEDMFCNEEFFCVNSAGTLCGPPIDDAGTPDSDPPIEDAFMPDAQPADATQVDASPVAPIELQPVTSVYEMPDDVTLDVPVDPAIDPPMAESALVTP